MPVYEYRCTQCHKVFEYQQRMADAAKTVCEECSGALERLISRSSFALKGDGWYKDLYSSAKPTATTTTEAAKPAASDSGTGTGTGTGTGSGTGGGTGGTGSGSAPSGGGGSAPPSTGGGGTAAAGA